MSCPLGASLCTATQLLRVLFVNKCSCIIYCMLYLDPGLRFAQPRLQCLREQPSISHKLYLLHNHSNSVKISECWFIRGQFTFISTQAWSSVPAEPDAHYSWFLPFMSPVSSGGPATWLMLPASPLKICLFLLGFRLFRLFYFQLFRHFWLISFLFLYASKGHVTQIPYVPKKLRQKDRCWWVGSAWSETWGRGIPGRHQMQNCNQTGLCD